MNLARILLFLALLLQRQPVDAEDIAQSVLIGQAYPSGNVYLRAFFNTRLLWPQSASLIALGKTTSDRTPARRGTFDRVLVDRTEGDVLKSLYIPGAEAMDQDHRPCGLGDVVRNNPAYTLLSDDFFGSVFDHCEPNTGVAIYRTDRSNVSVMTIGIGGSISLKASRTFPDRTLLRPLTPSERQEVDRLKADAVKNSRQQQCSTVPAYLDAAVQIFEGSLNEGNVTLRVSTYEDPGCAGHLRTIYILDVLSAGQQLQRFELEQHHGAI